MKQITGLVLEGERALFKEQDANIEKCIFQNGESPLKESNNIILKECTFDWKYPLWYSNNIKVTQTMFNETARSGIWYTNNITITDSILNCPKTFRKSSYIKLDNVRIANAQETFWGCNNIDLDHVSVKGDYFIFNSQNIKVNNFRILGNYTFDSCKNIEVTNAYMESKDSFWNCENVIVKDSTIIGEYIGWNSKNLTFVNCDIESLQGFCYIENLTLINCRLHNTTLAFEYSTVNVEVTNEIDSIKNPISGKIKAKKINEIILDDESLDKSEIEIIEG